jgi:hypothetical protein
MFFHSYKKRILVQNKLNLLLKIILYNTWKLQSFTIKTKLTYSIVLEIVLCQGIAPYNWHFLKVLILSNLTGLDSGSESFLAPNKRFSQNYSRFFQILVMLVTISDWPWWVSWKHFYSQSLPTKKLQATLPSRLPWRQATPQNIIRNSLFR